MDQFQAEVEASREAAHLENEINLLGMVESRIMEIVKIEDECKRKLPKLFNQRLPRFMRRRAASHNVKRLPKRLRLSTPSSTKPKSRKSLLRYRNRLRHRKHKRILKKHAKHVFKSCFKSNLHKWFAKRFKITTVPSGTKSEAYINYHNNTKNQRNLLRHSIYNCAYLSYSHLMAIGVRLGQTKDVQSNLQHLNKMTDSTTGFTFLAKILQLGYYEVAIHLYKPNIIPREFVCTAMVSMTISNAPESLENIVELVIPIEKHREVCEHVSNVNANFEIIKRYPKSWSRIRLVGPNSRPAALKIASQAEYHESCLIGVDILHDSFGTTVGRHIREEAADFTYYNTSPHCVDITFHHGEKGRALWNLLIKNKAHLVGGYRDIERVLTQDCFKMIPDDQRKGIRKRRN